MTHRYILTFAALLIAASAFGTTFIVPTDDELVAKSHAIVTGVVEGAYVQQTELTIETVYEIRVDRPVKGAAGKRDDLVRVVSPGGFIEGVGGVDVPGAAHFRQGDRVLLFLTRNQGRWEPTDLTLGKFRFVTSTAGERLLVRDAEDVVGWDRAGNVHKEKVRKADGFLKFVEERVAGRKTIAAESYEVDAADVTLPSLQQDSNFEMETNAAPFPGDTYTDYVNNQPIRWPSMASPINFYKRSTTNISGQADGGVGAIQSGLAAWTNDCASTINLAYAGQTATASANFDATHVVEFNDPQGRVGGSWTGSGTIAITFISFGGSHPFIGKTWWNITDADVVFQDGFPGTHAAFPAAMTHELGHGIGWRHSNQSHLDGQACNSAIEECTSAAQMNSSAIAAYGYTLQTWDKNAAQSVYPGSTCGPVCTPPSIVSISSSTNANTGATTFTATVAGTGPFSYQWYTGATGNTSSPIGGATGPSVVVHPTVTTSYWLRVTNACGSADRSAGTITVTPNSGITQLDYQKSGDFDGDGDDDIYWHKSTTRQNNLWLLNGSTYTSASFSSSDPGWSPQAIGDFNGDNRTDIFFRNSTTNETAIWFMNGATITTRSLLPVVSPVMKVEGAGDFNGDGREDVFFRNTTTGATEIWFMNGASRTVAASRTSDLDYDIVGMTDFSGDGKDDILFHNPNSLQNAMWIMNGAATSSAAIINTSTAPTWLIAGTGDINGDGKSDIFFWNSATRDTAWWLMNGVVRIGASGGPGSPVGYTMRAAGDYNRDGRLDIFWRNDTTGATQYWYLSASSITPATGGTMPDLGFMPVPSP